MKTEKLKEKKKAKGRETINFLCKTVLLAMLAVCVVLMNPALTARAIECKDHPLYTYELDQKNNAMITGYSGEEQTVTIPNKLDGHPVTEIGEWVFENNMAMQEIVFPKYLKKIGEGAFAYCDGLTKVNIPEGVTYIDASAFYICNNLEEVTFPTTLQALGANAFYSCFKIKEITIRSDITETPEGKRYIPGGVFSRCGGLKEITFVEGVTVVPEDICGSAFSLEKINLPSTLKKIGNYAFSGAERVKQVALPSSVTQIGDYAFGSMYSLEKINIPNSVTYIGEGAFQHTRRLTEIVWPKKVKTIASSTFAGSGVKEFTVPDSVETIGDEVFSGSDLEKLVIGTGVKNIGVRVVDQCDNIKQVGVKVGNPYLMVADGVIYADHGKRAVMSTKDCTSIKIKEGTQSIDAFAFYGDKIEKISFPSSIKTIGEYAFERTPFIENPANYKNGLILAGECVLKADAEAIPSECKIPSGVIKIADSAFSHCKNLTSVIFPDTVVEIGNNAFSGCGLKKISFGKGVKIIGESAFYWCVDLKEVVIPDSVETIKASAFELCYSLESVKLGKGIKTIGTRVFDGTALPRDKNGILYVDNWLCAVIENSNFGGTLYRHFYVQPGTIGIAQGLMANQPYVEKVTLPDSLKYINMGAFWNVNYLTEVVIPDGVECIGEGAFGAEPMLEKVTIGKNVKVIEDEAFAWNTQLKEIKFTGDAPTFMKGDDGQAMPFAEVVATIYYPADNKTWTESVRQNYGGKLTWVPYETETKDPTPAPSNISFYDVKEGTWQYAPALYAYEHDFMKGKKVLENGQIVFDPTGEVTRAEVAQVLYNMEAKPAVIYEDCFSDVPEGKWYTNAIVWAKQHNIVAGKNGVFDVSGKITREEMATMLKKYAAFKNYDVAATADLQSFEDVNRISAWAVDNMKWAIAKNVMKGKGSVIDPIGKTTRAECAAMLKNFCEAYNLK